MGRGEWLKSTYAYIEIQHGDQCPDFQSLKSYKLHRGLFDFAKI